MVESAKAILANRDLEDKKFVPYTFVLIVLICISTLDWDFPFLFMFLIYVQKFVTKKKEESMDLYQAHSCIRHLEYENNHEGKSFTE